MGKQTLGQGKGMSGMCPVVLSTLKVGTPVLLEDLGSGHPWSGEKGNIVDLDLSKNYAVVFVPAAYDYISGDGGYVEISLDQIVRIL